MPVKTRKQARVCPCTILATCARPVDIDVRAEGLITNCRATRSLQRPWLAYRGLAEYICMTWHMKRHPAARRKIDIRSACTKDCNPVPSGQGGQGAKRIKSDGAFHPHPHAIRGGGIAQTTQDTTSSEEDVLVLEPDKPGGTIASKGFPQP